MTFSKDTGPPELQVPSCRFISSTNSWHTNSDRITSRRYYNFTNDAQRHADTIKPFNERQSWDLFMKFLGPTWQQKDKDGRMNGVEEKAARTLLKRFGGVSALPSRDIQLIAR